MLLLPFLLTGLLLLWERWVRRRRWPNVEPVRAGPPLAVAALGVLSHPILDWLNNYGLSGLACAAGRGCAPRPAPPCAGRVVSRKRK
jgi:hypothetical protein